MNREWNVFMWQVITEHTENQGLLGDKDPSTLLNTLVDVLGLHFALRGQDEHRPLQLAVHTTESGRRCLQYREVG